MNQKLFALLVMPLFIFSGCSLSALGDNIKKASNSIGAELPSNRQIVFREITAIKDMPDFAAQAGNFATVDWSSDAELKSVKVEKDDSIFAYRALFESASKAVDKDKVATMAVYYNFSKSLINLDPQTAPYNKKSSIENNSEIVGVYDIKDEIISAGLGNIEPRRIKTSVKEISAIYDNNVSEDFCQEGELHFVNGRLEFDWGEYRFDPYTGFEISDDRPAATADTAASTTKPAVSKSNSSVDSNIDSDNDGLTDADEAKYGTDQKNPDTDGDGFKDGQEVKDGFNPVGAGKMTEAQLKIMK
jgi:hypothetical protein